MNIAENIMNSRTNIHQKVKTNKRNRNFSYDGLERNNEKSAKIVGDFKLGEKLGEGTFGKVRLATHILTKEKVKFCNKFVF